MKREVAEKWVADLRTPGLKQARQVLFDGKGYCCLGRLCVVQGREFEEIVTRDYVMKRTKECSSLPPIIRRETGVDHPEGCPRDDGTIKVGGVEYSSLASANDDGRTFAEIADAIEQNWERL